MKKRWCPQKFRGHGSDWEFFQNYLHGNKVLFRSVDVPSVYLLVQRKDTLYDYNHLVPPRANYITGQEKLERGSIEEITVISVLGSGVGRQALRILRTYRIAGAENARI